MPGIETKLWLALRSRLETLLPDMPKAWPSEVFTVPHANGLPQPYLRIGRVSVAPRRVFIADGQPYDRSGSLMVTLVHPLGQTVSVYDQIGATIADHFVDGTKMTYDGLCVTVPSRPHVQEGYSDNGYWTVPVRVPWRCFA